MITLVRPKHPYDMGWTAEGFTDVKYGANSTLTDEEEKGQNVVDSIDDRRSEHGVANVCRATITNIKNRRRKRYSSYGNERPRSRTASVLSSVRVAVCSFVHMVFRLLRFGSALGN